MKTVPSLKALVTVILAVGFVGGCSTPYFGSSGSSLTYTYEPRFNFTQVKTYRWVDAKRYDGDSLLESNVRFLTEQALGGKGFTSNVDKPDMLLSMRYEYRYGSGLRVLTLNISRADNNDAIWRGTATGEIKTDAAYSELKSAIEGMLVYFPPK